MIPEWTILRYSPEDADLWNRFVNDSRQGTFLLQRDYMDYHSNRFEDFSLIALRNNKATAILPANRVDSTLFSHQGLTYGGWLTPKKHFDGTDMLELFETWISWLRSMSFDKVIYKPIPHIYHTLPAEEDLYALFRYGATVESTQLSSVICLTNNPGFNTQQLRNLKKFTATTDCRIWETNSADEILGIVNSCLTERHNSVAVHSAAELQLLHDRFPHQIRFFLCGRTDIPEAAVCIYDTNSVAHCQYIATTPAGRNSGALAYLFNSLIHQEFADHKYFDFGTSNEHNGLILNSGLHHQKTGLGGRGIACPTYRLSF